MIDALAVIAAIGTILTAVVGAGIKGIWVWGRELTYSREASADRLQAERTEKLFWRDVALKAMGHTEKAIDLAATASKSSNG